MKKTAIGLSAFILLIAFTITNLSAQTMPMPFDLSLGHYNLTAWAADNPAGTYPPNMRFHTSGTGTGTADPNLTREMAADYTLAYNLTSGTRINGLGIDGIRFNNTSSPGNLGAAVLALNTTNRNSLKVSWNSKIIAQGVRIYGLRLQYRIGAGAFQAVLDAFGNPVEVIADMTKPSGVTGAEWAFAEIKLPLEAENQPVVYLRWKYYYISGSDTRPSISIDDISVTSESSIGVPTKLHVAAVNPPTPSSNFPFSITVLSTDANNVPKFVSSNTTVTLSVISGSAANLIGNLTATIPAGSYMATFTNLKYTLATDLTVQLSATALTPTTKTISFIEGPASIRFANLNNKTHKNFPLASFLVEAVSVAGNPVATYHNQIATLSKVSGPGNLVGTTSQPFIFGVATFNNITFDASGLYTLSLSAPGFDTPLTTTVLVADEIAQNELNIPIYIKGGFGGLGDGYGPRLPAFALVEFTNLLPNTTYRYISGATQLATYDINPPNNNGAGNNIHYNANTRTYLYNSFRSFSFPTDYSQFTTGPFETSRKVWVNIVPTTNAAFNAGNNIYWLVALAFEDGRFIKRFMTTKTSSVLDYGTDANTASGIYDENSWLAPNTFIAMYDNINSDAIATGVVQSIGAKLQTLGFSPQTPQYFADLEEVNSAWAAYLPNNLPSGVRKIIQYDANGNVLRQWTDADGVWANVNTINPRGGRYNPISFQTPQLQLTSPTASEAMCNHQDYRFTWNSHGVERINIEISFNGGTTYEMLHANLKARDGYFEWDIPRRIFAERLFSIKITSIEHPYINSTIHNAIIWDNPIEILTTKSEILCEKESIMLSIVSEGSNLKYQWFKDGMLIPCATTNMLNLNNVKYINSGTYHVLVEGNSPCPILRSKDIEIYVATPTAISKQPNNAVALPNGNVSFYAEAHIHEERDKDYFNIQWYKGTTPLVDDQRIAGSRSNLLTIRNVVSADESDEYFVVFNGLCPTSRVESRKVSLKLVDLMFASHPENLVVCENTDITFVADAITSTNETITYQWFKGNNPLSDNARISGANTNKLSITDVTIAGAGNYHLEARLENIGITVLSNPATLSVDLAPVIIVQPDDNIVVEQGKTISMSVTVTSASPATYQWYKNDVEIAGATNSVYTKADAEARDGGEYYVVIKNYCGETKSDVAFVTITLKNVTSVNNGAVAGLNGLLPISPNPTKGPATINFLITQDEMVTITISDQLGNNIATIFDAIATSGANSINYDASALSAGMYIVTMKTSRLVFNEKLVIIK